MNLVFKYPRKGKITDQKKSYITSPRHHFVCSNFTISVLDLIDDMMMTHESKFSYGRKNNKNNGYKVGDCFRWLQSFRDFYVDTCTMRLDSSAMTRKRCGKKPNRDIYT